MTSEERDQNEDYEQRISRMPAQVLPDFDQKWETEVQAGISHVPQTVPEPDAKVLEDIGFTVDRDNRIGWGGYGAVFTGTANGRAVRYHPRRNTWGRYFVAVLRHRLYPYLPIRRTTFIDRNYHSERIRGRVAVKFINMADAQTFEETQEYRDEARTMALLHHPNIAEIYDSLVIGRRLYIIMEFCPNDNLGEFLAHRQTLSGTLAQSFVRQLTAGLLHMHDAGVSHADIHMRNVMVVRRGTRDRDIVLKYVDFGVAEMLGNKEGALRRRVLHDLQGLGHLFLEFCDTMDANDPLLADIRQLADGLVARRFESLRDAIRQFRFMHPQEYRRLNNPY